MKDIYAEIMSAAHSGSFGMNSLPLPTVEQLRAGNYRKGKVSLHGMTIAIETPQGQPRTGKSDGKPWSVICMAHYGYIVGTKASDGDAIDVYVGPVPESQKVWVVNQNDKAGNFDEVKVLLGFHDEQSARTAYLNSYERGWQGLGSLVACSLDQFRWWLKFGDTTKPLTDRALPHKGNDEMNETVWDSAANPVGCTAADLIYRLRGQDQDGLLLDAVTVNDILEGSDGEMTLDALVVQYNKVERKAEQLRRIMESVGGDVKPVSVQITPPFKQRGTTNVVMVFELSDGQTVSIWMHNPDSTPNRIKPDDELVSWAWRLNKKDVSIIVAPEKGQDLNPREVSRRIMRLAEKNSARFAKANEGRAARMENIEAMKGDVAAKEATLAALDTQHAELTEKVTAKRNRVPATLQGTTQGADTDIEMNQQTSATVEGESATVQGQERHKSEIVISDLIEQFGWKRVSAIEARKALSGATYAARFDDRARYLSLIDDNDPNGGVVVDVDTRGLEPLEAAGMFNALATQKAEARPAVYFDPTTPEGYWKIFSGGGNEELALAYQDQLDSLFQGRLIDVRNSLRNLGWDGEKFKALSKGGNTLVTDLWQVGAGANIAGIVYKVSGQNTKGGADVGVRDDLSLTPVELAGEIDYFVKAANAPAQAEQAKSEPAVATLLWSEGSNDTNRDFASFDDLESWFKQTFSQEKMDARKADGWQYAKNKVRLMLPDRGEVVTRIDVSESQGDFNPNTQSLRDYLKADGYELPKSAATGDEVIQEIIGSDSVMIGKTRYESGAGGYYSTGRNSKPLTAAILTADGSSFELDDYALLRQAGSVTITSVGSENVYFTKGGVPYYTKLLNTDSYAVGEADFSGVAEVVGPAPVVADAAVPNPLTQVFSEWLDAEWAASRYQAEYLEDTGDELKAKYAAVSGGGDTESSARQQYQKELLDRPRDASIDLRVYDQYEGDQAVQRALTRHFFDLEGRLSARSTDELLGRKDSPEEVAKQARMAAISAEIEAINAITNRTASGTKADGDRQKRLARLQDELVKLQRLGLGEYPDYKATTDLSAQPDAIDEDPEQANFSKFNRASVKMPTAVQLSLNTTKNPILISYKGQEGWSNGHILALHKPKVVTDAIAKYHVDETSLRRLSEDAVSRVVPRDATLKVEPIALYDNAADIAREKANNVDPKFASTKFKSVILADESAGVAVPVDARYFGYFDKQFKQPDYFVSRDGSGAVVVKKAGEVVGVMMPIKGTSNMLKRAAKAAGTATDTADKGKDALPNTIITFGTDQTSENSVVLDRDQWMRKNVPADQMGTDGDEGIGSIDNRLVYRINDGRLAYWDMGLRSFIEVSPDASGLVINQPKPADDGRAEILKAKKFLEDVIAGNVDYMDEGLADRLKAIYGEYEGDAEMQALLEQAANAYSDYMIKAARAALA